MTVAPYLSFLIFLPILIGLALALFPKQVGKSAQILSSFVAIATLVISGAITSSFFSGNADIRFVNFAKWMPGIGANYFVGVDSMAAWMILLTAFLTLIAILISKPSEKSSQFFGLLLCLEGTLFGVFSSLDMLLFYIFFELSLIPVGLMILGWGSGERGKVALRYVGVLFAGSLLMLVGIAILGVQAQRTLGFSTLSVVQLQRAISQGLWQNAWPLQALAFWGFMIAFLVKSPAVPIHRWLADTYEDAPIGAIVAGVVLKVGTFGMFRFVLPIFPEACKVFAPVIVLVGVVGILYGGILAAIQKSPGRLMAYSTVSHVGYILIGLFSLNHYGMMGAAFQQFNHGIAAAAIFVLLNFLYERTPNRSLDSFGGLKKSMPIFSTLFLVAMLANLGLPFTSGFVGEILSLIGVFMSGQSGLNGVSIVYAYLAAGGAILSAAYMLYMYQRLFYGKAKEGEPLKDLSSRETLVGVTFAAIILILGLLPTVVLKSMEPRIQNMQGEPKAAVVRTEKAPTEVRVAEVGGKTSWK